MTRRNLAARVPGPGVARMAGTPLSNPPREGRHRPGRIPITRLLGVFAGTGTPHPFVNATHSTSCWACFGWRDDMRHTYGRQK